MTTLATQHDATVDSLVLAAWQVYLARFAGNAQVVVDCGCDGRSYEELLGTVGPLAKNLPLRCEVAAGTPFLDHWKAQIAHRAELYEWQEYFSWNEIEAEGSEAATPWVTFGFDNVVYPAASETGGLRAEWLRLAARLDRCELQLVTHHRAGEALTLELWSDPGIYAADDIERCAEQLATLVEHVASEPTVPLGQIRLASRAEQRALLVERHATLDFDGSAEPGEALIHQLFEHQVEVDGGRPALVYEEVRLSYSELDERANRLAHHLRDLGVGPETPVAVCLERSQQVIVALLGILKAGGAYLPVDPALPAERTRFMLETTATEVMLTQASLLAQVSEALVSGAQLPKTTVRSTVVIDRDAERIAERPATAPSFASTPSSLAYILFTSGSTGQPKGVMVEHRQLVAYVRGVLPRLDLAPGAHCAMVSSFAADLGNTMLYGALASGGCLHVVSQDRLTNPDAFADYCEREGIDALKIVPSHLAAFQSANRPARVLPRRRLVLGGEAARREWVEELQQAAPECRILNHYGPTETTVGVLTHQVEELAKVGSGLPLGRPLDGSRIYILSRAGQPSALWEAGELVIGGRNVARGYAHRPALTAERFVPDPFAGTRGARMYRTGDRARSLTAGGYEFLGRLDHQVKLHGFRIELGEIETATVAHPQVRECVAMLRDDDGQRLVAYVVPQETMPEVSELRDFLGRRLPDFMLPAAFVPLEALPLNANGKVDRRRLPAPDPGELRSRAEYVAPRNSIELQLSEAWAEVLGLEQIGINDNFFHLGGDSIRSIELRAKARQRGLEFTIADVFQHQTIAALAAFLGTRSGGTEPADDSNYEPFALLSDEDRAKIPEGVEDAFPLGMMQQGMLFHSLSSTDATTYHDVGSYRFRIPFEPDAFRRAIARIAARHAAIRTSFDYTTFSEPLQLIHRHVEVPVGVEDWRPQAEDDKAWEDWVAKETHNAFDWQQAPLFRTFLFQLSDEACQLTVSFHHAILDGWSRHSLVTELMREYLREMGWDLPPLEPLPDLSYGEFVATERATLASEATQAFWSRTLSDSPRVVLPRRPQVPRTGPGLDARVEVFTLPEEISKGLHALAKRTGVPVKSLLLAAHLDVLSLLSGQDDVRTGLVVNGRLEREAGDLMSGLFLNSVPLRSQLRGGSWLDLIRATFEAEASVLPHRRYPIAELQRLYGGGERLLEINFNFMHYHIYRRVLEVRDVEFLGYRGFEETDLPCVVNFHQDPQTDDIQLGIEYHAAVFHYEQVDSMVHYFRRIFAAMVRDPEARYEHFSPLSPAEQQQLLVSWNDTSHAEPVDDCLDALLWRQAERSPNEVAVVCEDRRLTYRELAEQADLWAAELVARGVGPEARVALLMERSIELIVALWAVARAGGAYVPLDPEQPPARLGFLLGDIRPSALLTQKHLRERLPETPTEVLCLDQPRAERAAPMTVARRSQPDNAAYVIYTSGSTGQPKGAINTHRAICNRLRWMQQEYGLTADDRVLQKTPYTFDVSVWELFWPLLYGARLVLARPGGHRDGSYLLQTIASQSISTLHFVPSMLQVFLEQSDVASHCVSLRRVICSGEALPTALAERFQQLLGGGADAPSILHNLYGPTEAAIDVTYETYDSEISSAESLTSVPIGRPITNTRIYLLDRHLRPVPLGVPAQLFIAGTGLARGYLDRPGLTAEKFIPDPWSGRADERLYASGDLARHLPGGRIEFLRRIDGQVKIRGFRVELGEIESALLQIPAVREAVVAARGDGVDRFLVAYWVGTDPGPEAEALRQALGERLPSYMVPSHFERLSEMPLSVNGKLDRRALPEVGAAATPQEAVFSAPRGELERRIATVWSEVLQLEQVSVTANFFDLGGHSLHLLRAHIRLREALGRDVPMVDLFQYPSVRGLAEHLRREAGEQSATSLGQARAAARQRVGGDSESEIAIVGMSGRFPGAKNLEKFWRNLSDGVESIARFSEEELREAGVPAELFEDPSYVPARGVLDDIDLFDAALFQFSPLEASVMDPQHRLFLECSWQALEDAGYDTSRDPSDVGVFAGIGMNTYAFGLYADPELVASVGGYQTMLANDKDYMATRVAYKLDLRGPSMVVQTACSTSLVAVHVACQSLLRGESDMALAGGVRIAVPDKKGYLYQEGGIHSPDGHCRAFDAAAGGMVGGDGVGVVVLKRLRDALDAGDEIRAVIRGSAVNNDGARRVGYTAPGVEGQARVISEAQAIAGVDARDIGYIEAHGTGTELGDPIEVAALTQAFRQTTEDRGFCSIGSLKTNIGHLDAAAGVAGLIKTVLALQHQTLPPSLHFERPNPKIDLEASPFRVQTECAPWPNREVAGEVRPRLAGVSSLGIGGTNAHVVVEEAPVPRPSGPARAVQILPLSARIPSALGQIGQRLGEHLEAHPEIDLADTAYTLQVGRRELEQRRAFVCRDAGEAREALAGEAPKCVVSGHADPRQEPTITFLFPGQGAQYVGMAADLYRDEPVFRQVVDHCAGVLEGSLRLDLRQVIWPAEPNGPEGSNGPEGPTRAAADQLRQTRIAQPALFVIELAIARLLQSWGVEPEAVMGHSIGEYVGAVLAGIFELDDALQLVASRGELMQSVEPGAMLAIEAEEETVRRWLGDDLAIAAVNAPTSIVVSGPTAAIEALAERLQNDGTEHQRLHTSHAFHSSMMEPIVESFVARVAAVPRKAPQLPLISNLTGTWILPEEATDPAYWGHHLRQAVRFADGLTELLQEPHRILLEVGPGRALGTFARRHPDRAAGHLVLGTLRPPKSVPSDIEPLWSSLARLWTAGVAIDWLAFQGTADRNRLSLPTYPFEGTRHWLQSDPASVVRRSSTRLPAIDDRLEAEDWFFLPQWIPTPLPAAPPSSAEPSANGQPDDPPCCLLLLDASGLGEALAQALEALGARTVRVERGEHFEALSADRFVVDPERDGAWDEVLSELAQQELRPTRIVHLWGLTAAEAGDRRVFRRGGSDLIHLLRALESQSGGGEIAIDLVANGLLAVTEGEEARPETAPLLALSKIIPQEYPQFACRAIDVRLPPGSGQRQAPLARLLRDEMFSDGDETVVAYRGRQRWIEHIEPTPLALPDEGDRRLRRGGVYLVTGGLGGATLAWARLLADGLGAHLVLFENPFPGSDSAPDPSIVEAISGELQDLGGEVLTSAADATDPGQVEQLLDQVTERFGRLDGVVHTVLEPQGMPSFSPLAELDSTALENDLERRASATHTLAGALRGRSIDFCLLVSSNASILGGLGALPWAAGSAFAAAYASRRAQREAAPWLGVHWDYRSLEAGSDTEARGESTAYDADPAEALATLERLVANPDLGCVAVSPIDLRTRLQVARDHQKPSDPPGTQHPRPELSHEYVAPRGETEEEVAAIWQQLLGIESVGRHDDFFELGGHSLLATQLASRLRTAFRVDVGMRRLFESPTVAGLAELIVESQMQTVDDDALAQLLREVESLSQEEAQALISAEKPSI
ncbi:MAG: amino acid adenylation domain-containing protein [Acidobacteriota bacterium]